MWGLTSIFLEMWEVAMGYEITTDYTVYMPTVKMPSDGFVQPFCDGPANNPNNPAEDVYTHLINKARDYVYITTPYLVIDRKMAEDLCRTARSGVDVKIIVPYIYDKWYVYMVNVANYGPLIAERCPCSMNTCPDLSIQRRLSVMMSVRSVEPSTWITGAFICTMNAVCSLVSHRLLRISGMIFMRH